MYRPAFRSGLHNSETRMGQNSLKSEQSLDRLHLKHFEDTFMKATVKTKDAANSFIPEIPGLLNDQ